MDLIDTALLGLNSVIMRDSADFMSQLLAGVCNVSVLCFKQIAFEYRYIKE